MKKYAIIVDDSIGSVNVGLNDDNIESIEYYKSIGYTLMDVAQSDIDNQWYLEDKCPMKTEGEKAREEQERLMNLKMTALDLINYIKSEGLTDTQINSYLESNLSLKMQLTYCQNVYCGVLCKLTPLKVEDLTITQDKVIAWFKDKNNEND